MLLTELSSLIESKQEFTVLKGYDWEEDEKAKKDFPELNQEGLDKISLIVNDFIEYNNHNKLEIRYYKNYSPFGCWNNAGLFSMDICNPNHSSRPRIIISVFAHKLNQNKFVIKKHLSKYIKTNRLGTYDYNRVKLSLRYLFWLEENKEELGIRKFTYNLGWGGRKPNLNFITNNIRVKIL